MAANIDAECLNDDLSGNESSLEIADESDEDSQSDESCQENELTENSNTNDKWQQLGTDTPAGLNLLDFHINNTPDIIKEEEITFEAEETPLAYFQIFMTDEILNYIAEQTNKYHKQTVEILKASDKLKKYSRILRWKEVDITDIKNYLGIILWMGIHSNKNYQGNFYNSN